MIVGLLSNGLESIDTVFWLIDFGKVSVPVGIELTQLSDNLFDRSVERDEFAAGRDLNLPLGDDEVRFITKDRFILGGNSIGDTLSNKWSAWPSNVTPMMLARRTNLRNKRQKH